MPTKDGLILCGCLLDNATHKKFEKICKDMGSTTYQSFPIYHIHYNYQYK